RLRVAIVCNQDIRERGVVVSRTRAVDGVVQLLGPSVAVTTLGLGNVKIDLEGARNVCTNPAADFLEHGDRRDDDRKALRGKVAGQAEIDFRQIDALSAVVSPVPG